MTDKRRRGLVETFPLLLFALCTITCSAPREEAASTESTTPPTSDSPTLDSQGFVTFSTEHVEWLQKKLETAEYPTSWESFIEQITIPEKMLQKGLGVSATDVWTQNYRLNDDCSLRMHSGMWGDGDELVGAEVQCGSPLPGESAPAPLRLDLDAALAHLGATDLDFESLPSCSEVLAGLDPDRFDCYRLPDRQALFVQTGEKGFRVAQRELPE